MGSTHTLSTGTGIGLGLTISSNGTFMTGTKCPSSNFLRTATTGQTAFTSTTTTKSSAILTQCNSNKQINGSGNVKSKETPETTARQKIRLAGSALSSTNKRNAHNTGPFTTLSSGS